MIIKRKKITRYRGSHTHGRGAKKKRRGAGHRGGRGMAGSGKRADKKKPTILKLYGKGYYGKSGFKRPLCVMNYVKGINVGFICDHIDGLVNKGLIKKEGDIYYVNIEELGAGKLLGSGRVEYKLYVKTSSFSKLAKEKIEAKKGRIEEYGDR